MVTKYKKTIVTMPPGRVGIHLEDLVSDVSSTIVTAVSPSSPLAGMVFQGDSIICVNDVDVRKMDTLGKAANNNRGTLHFLDKSILIKRTFAHDF